MEAVSDVKLRRCAKCRVEFPANKQYFYAHAGEGDHLSNYCKGCADAAKKRYKLKYRRNHADENIGKRIEPKIRLSSRVEYALLTGKCPRCGGQLQRYLDSYENNAPCMACMMCSREVWLPPLKEVTAFLQNPPTAVKMPYWVAQQRGIKRNLKRTRSDPGRRQ